MRASGASTRASLPTCGVLALPGACTSFCECGMWGGVCGGVVRGVFICVRWSGCGVEERRGVW